jgi:hypothetical protein
VNETLRRAIAQDLANPLRIDQLAAEQQLAQRPERPWDLSPDLVEQRRGQEQRRDVPGAQELKTFYLKNAGNFPWTAMAGGGATSMQKAMADVQRKMAAGGGVTLLQTIKTKSAGSGAQAAQMQAGMAQARAQMEAMAKQGGPQAAAAQQAAATSGPAPAPVACDGGGQLGNQ